MAYLFCDGSIVGVEGDSGVTDATGVERDGLCVSEGGRGGVAVVSSDEERGEVR